MPRIQYKRYALINKQGIIWEGLTKPTRSGLYPLYKGIGGTGYRAACADGWTVKPVFIAFTI